MIKLIISELEFNDCPNRPSGIGYKQVFLNEKLVESVEIVEHTIYTFKGEYFYTPQGSYSRAEGSSVISFKELTMSSGVKYLTMEKLDFIEGFGGDCMNQYSFWHREHQVLVTPIESTLRDPNVYSLNIWVYAPNRTTILEDYINTDEVFWKGFDNKDNIVHYYTRWIDNNGDWNSIDDECIWEEG